MAAERIDCGTGRSLALALGLLLSRHGKSASTATDTRRSLIGGGTSLSKGFQIIHRFSEDIDIRIELPAQMDVNTRESQTRPAHIKSRADFYEWLTKRIRIDGIVSVERDTSVDNKDLFSAGIRLAYRNVVTPI